MAVTTVVAPVGSNAHAVAVSHLLDSYRAVPPGAPVRLAKRTSNVFRTRSRNAAPGLDVSGLDGVISIDPDLRTADVQGMCTYERLVDATLVHDLMPMVVPQLKTITLGGAVTGLGVESSSFRNGLPHESVLELDVLTGAGEVLTATPTEHADLFAAFPNSYGSLGYATRLRIALEPVRPRIALQHVRFDDFEALATAIGGVVTTGRHGGEPVDFVDGVVFEPGRSYVSLGRWTDTQAAASDYTGQQVFYRSIERRDRDVLTTLDYLWRWDTDWFWCSGAFGAQNPALRRIWPRRWRRSDVYHRLVGLNDRFGVVERLDRWKGRPRRERVVQDVEIPLERLGEFLTWFDAHVGMRPVWLCPLRLREPEGPGSARTWPLYPLEAGRTYVNVGFWGNVAMAPGAADGDINAMIEAKVSALDGHKSLYSNACYDEETFDRLYGGAVLKAAKERYDPDGRLTGLYDKVVRRR